jgi:hypothetical protein
LGRYGLKRDIPLIVLFCIYHCSVNSQDSTLKQLPKKYLSDLQCKSNRFEEQVDKGTDKAFARFIKQGQRMKSKRWKIDSVNAKNVSLSNKMVKRYEQDLRCL